MGIFDLSWIKDLGLGVRRESGSSAGHEWALLSFPETSIHHENRCLWRLVVFAAKFPGAWRSPLFSLDLERDILGDFCLCLHEGDSCLILDRFGAAPRYEDFRRRALAELSLRLPVGGSRGRAGALRAARTAGGEARRH